MLKDQFPYLPTPSMYVRSSSVPPFPYYPVYHHCMLVHDERVPAYVRGLHEPLPSPYQPCYGRTPASRFDNRPWCTVRRESADHLLLQPRPNPDLTVLATR